MQQNFGKLPSQHRTNSLEDPAMTIFPTIIRFARLNLAASLVCTGVLLTANVAFAADAPTTPASQTDTSGPVVPATAPAPGPGTVGFGWG
jgi:hypothetical protein